MKQSFNQVNKIRYIVFSDPLNPIAMVVLVLFCTAGIIDYNGILFKIMWVFAVIVAAVFYTRQNGHPRFLSKRLSEYFFSFRPFCGRWLIAQRKNRKQKNLDCRKLLRDLTDDAEKLTAALRDLPGRYRAITHQTVIDRLEGMEEAEVTMKELAYTATLEKTVAMLTGNSCKSCKKKCPFPNRRMEREFFDIRFEIK